MSFLVAEIQSADWLYLRAVEEPDVNALRLVLEEGRVGEAVDVKALAEQIPVPEIATLLEGARVIAPSKGCRLFELSWDSYVAYSVRNESFVAADDYEHSEGRILRKYARSRFLDYIASATFADAAFPGPFWHWGVLCSDHILDVISCEEPVIRVLSERA